MNTVIRKCWILLGANKSRLPFITSLYLLNSALELLGIGLLIPFIGSFIRSVDQPSIEGEQLPGNTLSDAILSSFDTSILNDFDKDLILSLAILSAFISKFLLSVAIAWITTDFSQKQRSRIARELLQRFLTMDYSAYMKRKQSDGLYETQTVSGDFYQMLQLYMKIFSDVITISFIMVLMALVQPEATIIISAGLVALSCSYVLFSHNFAKRLGVKRNLFESKIVDVCQNALAGFREVRLLNKRNYFLSKLYDNVIASGRINRSKAILSILPKQFLEISIIFAICSTFILRETFGLSDEQYLEIIIVFSIVGLRLLPLISGLVAALNHAGALVDSVSRIYNLLGTPEESDQSQKSMPVPDFRSIEQIQLKDVSFCYEGQEAPVIEGLNFEIQSGDVIGLIGQSGVGKTTFLDLVCGFVKPTAGTVKHNIGKMKSNNPGFAYLPSNPAILSGSVEENVAFSNDLAPVELARIQTILEEVGLVKTLSEMSEGLETDLGQSGSRLSAGQKQRLGIARAIFHRPNFLILDEATNANDEDTERVIFEGLRRSLPDVAMIVVSHRQSTLRFCDRVFAMSGGKLHPVVDPNQYFYLANKNDSVSGD